MRVRWRVGVLLVVVLLVGCTDSSSPELESPFVARAAEITDLYPRNEWTEIRRDFDANMREKLTEEMLAEGWTTLTASAGEYESRGEPRVVDKRDGLTVIDTPMYFERTEMKSRVTFRADGTIAGFFILQKDVPVP